MTPSEPDCTTDDWLGGRLRLRQPRKGHRAGTDAALLAAVGAMDQGRLLDVGAGVGAVGLACAARMPNVQVTLVEREPAMAAMARENIVHNGLAERVDVAEIDVCAAAIRRGAGLVEGYADAVLTNPPFFNAREVRSSPDPRRARAHVLEATLEQWIAACVAMLRPGGLFAMIHRADALALCLAAAQGRLGAVMILPVYPRLGAMASRLILRGVKGSRAKAAIAAGLVLHEPGGDFTPQAQALHRGEAWLEWPDQ